MEKDLFSNQYHLNEKTRNTAKEMGREATIFY